MTVEAESLTLNYLRVIRATQADHDEWLTQIELQRYSTLGKPLGTPTKVVFGEKLEMDILKKLRMARINKRCLELADVCISPMGESAPNPACKDPDPVDGDRRSCPTY